MAVAVATAPTRGLASLALESFQYSRLPTLLKKKILCTLSEAFICSKYTFNNEHDEESKIDGQYIDIDTALTVCYCLCVRARAWQKSLSQFDLCELKAATFEYTRYHRPTINIISMQLNTILIPSIRTHTNISLTMSLFVVAESGR